VAAGRDPEVPDPLSELRASDLAIARGVLPLRFATELGVRLHQLSRAEGAALVDALGPLGRARVRELTSSSDTGVASAARSLLGSVPATPTTSLSIDVLGPVRVCRGGEETHDSALRRDRVRSLLAFLLLNRETTRSALTAALWPDFDDRSGANNLRVTLNHLAGLLEPERAEGEAPYYLRSDGSSLRFVTRAAAIDLDRFYDEIALARGAEADGAPSVALGHHLTAVDLYRGPLFTDVPDAEWMDLAREQARSRFVTSAVRGAELLHASGDPDRAAEYAKRAIAEDPWSEPAHCVLVESALSAGDRSAAVRLLDRCREMLRELGVEPSEQTQGLGRRLAATSS
jgi:DNA-binding SARP family transcriptional activator